MSTTTPASPTEAVVTDAGGRATQPRRARFRLSGWTRLLWPAVALALILLFNFIRTPNFFQLDVVNGQLRGYVITILDLGTPVMLLALGMTLVIATGGIDLSVGAVMAITGAVASVLIVRPPDSALSAVNLGGSMTAIFAFSLGIALLCGLWNGVLVALVGIQPIIATLILMVSGRGVAQLITAGQIVNPRDPSFAFLAGGTLFMLPFTITLVAAMALIALVLTRGTALGLFLESVGNNPRASRYSGVNARLVKLLAYVFSGFCAGLAGLIATADIMAADANNTGLYLELDAILAVSIGGTALTGGRFSLAGSLIGALVIQSLTTTLLAQDVQREVDLMIKAGVVIVVCLLQSETFRARLVRAVRRTPA
ncbi:MAG TPA: ABC transporter permease [Tepidisphaeraceae bacterium]|nr:ABC transporter permease [Tepidisphaeraceae bacterium]